jgi:hypothetical protein
MNNDSEKEKEIDEICQRIQNLITAEHLTDEEKLSFARKALEIIQKSKEVAQ